MQALDPLPFAQLADRRHGKVRCAEETLGTWVPAHVSVWDAVGF